MNQAFLKILDTKSDFTFKKLLQLQFYSLDKSVLNSAA
jgi:hypothetical protein